MLVRQADRAGLEVEENHGDTLSLQRGKLIDVRYAGLEVVFVCVVRFGTAEVEGEVLGVEGGDLSLKTTRRC